MAHAVFLWHMHQPYYVNPASRTAMMPWVRLHAVKGYLDMVSILDEFPEMRVNFNMTPVLLLQIIELSEGRVHDLWMDWARRPAAQLEEHERLAILENFFKIHWENLVKPFPRYWELLNKRGLAFEREEARRELRYWSLQEFIDLQTWFNLAWCGYTAERLYPELGELKRKGRHFSEGEKNRVLDIHQEILGKIIPLYREAEKRGQVEITTTPFFHPILPLVYDSDFAERSMPGRQLPKRFQWPQDALAHLKMAVEQHTELFGKAPRGLWPSEGSIAPELVALMQEAGIRYFCSDEENLFRSLEKDPAFRGKPVNHLEMFQGWRVEHDGASVQAVFREKPLSDFIGFMAAKNRPEDAAAHLLHHLSNIARALPKKTGVIPLILDGENAWETFPDGGQGFLRALYAGVLKEPLLQSSTIEEYLALEPPAKTVHMLHTGSWISSNFDIWIGEEEENRAWDLLGETRLFLQSQLDAGQLTAEQQKAALLEVYAAEGSDWFWWYGPDFSTENDALFDDLFRQHLKNVYTLCGKLPPARMEEQITAMRVAPLYSTPERLVSRELTGRRSSYFDWMGAGCYVAGSEQGAMYRSGRMLKRFFFGNDIEFLYLRLDPIRWENLSVRLEFHGEFPGVIELSNLDKGGQGTFVWHSADGEQTEYQGLVARDVVELEVPLSLLGLNGDAAVRFQVKVFEGGLERECYPERVPIEFNLTRREYALEHWMV
ncbi:MAG: GH57 family [Verrucomicrobia bacterium]|nr:MAG: GH57 family [Verrucomicrobiota bacterium]